MFHSGLVGSGVIAVLRIESWGAEEAPGTYKNLNILPDVLRFALQLGVLD